MIFEPLALKTIAAPSPLRLERSGYKPATGVSLQGWITGVGLAPIDTSPSNTSVRQIGTVVGLGIGVPIANRVLVTQTSIYLHAFGPQGQTSLANASPEGFEPVGQPQAHSRVLGRSAARNIPLTNSPCEEGPA